MGLRSVGAYCLRSPQHLGFALMRSTVGLYASTSQGSGSSNAHVTLRAPFAFGKPITQVGSAIRAPLDPRYSY
jgi:hypothetical protein